MKFNPARSACYRLPSVFCSPPFHKTHSYGAHSRQRIHGFKTLINGLSQQSSKFLVVEDLQITAWWSFTHCCRVPAVSDYSWGSAQRLHYYLGTQQKLPHLCNISALLFLCLLVVSTVAFLFTLESKPRQNLSEFDGSVKPSTVSEGCEAWKVSPTLWFNS